MKTPSRLLLILLATTPLVACNSGSRKRAPASTTPAQTTTPALAQVRVLHASADAPAVDVLVDGQVALSSVPYQTGSAFLDVPEGKRSFKVNVAGTSTTAFEVEPTLVGGQAYTVLAVGRLAAIEPLLLPDDLSAPASGNLKLRVVHAHPSAGPVDVYLTAPGDDLATATPAVPGAEFKDASAFVEVAAGDYRARITPKDQKTVVYDSGALPLAAGANLTLVATESAGGPSPVTVIALTGDANTPSLALQNQTARLRAVHASPDAPAVDVLVDGQVVQAGVTFRQSSPYLELNSGAHRVQVNPANTTMSVIDANRTLVAGASYTVIAADIVNRIAPLVLLDESTAPAAGKIKLRLVHGAPTAGTVDVYVTAPNADLALETPAISGFQFKDVSAYLEVAAGDYRVRVTLGGTKSVVIDTGTVSLAAGQVRTGIAVDPAPSTTTYGALLLADRN